MTEPLDALDHGRTPAARCRAGGHGSSVPCPRVVSADRRAFAGVRPLRRLASSQLAKSGDDDVLRSVAEAVLQIIMEADVEGVIGAGRHERSAERTMWLNGYRDRTLGLNLKVPKLRQGSCVPGFPNPRKPVGKALIAVSPTTRARPRPGVTSPTDCAAGGPSSAA